MSTRSKDTVHHGQGYVSYQVLAELVLVGWKNEKPIKDLT